MWFLETLPRLRSRASELGLIEFTQHAGETVFLPEGWWHAVLNLDRCVPGVHDAAHVSRSLVAPSFQVAVTHNGVLPESLPSIRHRLATTHAELARFLGVGEK